MQDKKLRLNYMEGVYDPDGLYKAFGLPTYRETFDRVEELQSDRYELLDENRRLRKMAAPVFSINGRFSCLVTPEQLAEVLQCSIKSLERWEKEGKLPAPVRLPKKTPTGKGKGKAFVRFDLAEVLTRLKKFQF
jgi:hypothetical protein